MLFIAALGEIPLLFFPEYGRLDHHISSAMAAAAAERRPDLDDDVAVSAPRAAHARANAHPPQHPRQRVHGGGERELEA